MGCSSHKVSDEKYLWLEDIEGEKALNWVKQHNEETQKKIANHPEYKTIENEVREIVHSKERIPYPVLLNNMVYNFWQDEQYVKGIWRKTSLKNYENKSPQWETILDLDKLSKQENKNWVWKGYECLPPKYEKCLVYLSDGGKDAYVTREFDLKTQNFVINGFTLPEGKNRVNWINENQLFVGKDWGKGSLTLSGYPKIIKIWKRGQPLESSEEIFRGEEQDVSVTSWSHFEKSGALHLIYRYYSFFTSEKFIYTESKKLLKIPIPDDAKVLTIKNGELFFLIRTPLTQGTQTIPSGSICSIQFRKSPTDASKDYFSDIKVLFQPSEGEAFDDIIATKNHLYLTSLKQVQSVLYEILLDKKKNWILQKIDLPNAGTIAPVYSDTFDDKFIISYESFLTPTSLLLGSHDKKHKLVFKTIKSLPVQFNSKDLTVEQKMATSKDGTKIPYYLIRHKKTLNSKNNPTLLYGYGGFEASELPYYISILGKSWLSRGGVYVLSNLRGGGEFGPKWHLDGIKEKKQNVFDDFIAVAEDLINNNITTPQKLGIMGGSNGGLLVGATFTQRPELFKAVICQVPLLDMLRYHQLLAGNSWINEYGNPDDPQMRAVIKKYSPFQNIEREKSYPVPLFITSTKDDRVHPGHARKMAAKMEDLGHKVYYYENTAGGHAADADLNDRILRRSLELSYLIKQLMN
ncbi:MAG: prolyl oligopeptidase family serine peptidase [Bdellovibrionaceae bacterium]|nr:prolyl oligopeptidase family serine peptidase [Pseudobdellovibrionaceae bacterium]NUM58948.1 S9 family peptidase [Pseudobdellovibrionaceae bacterium]